MKKNKTLDNKMMGIITILFLIMVVTMLFIPTFTKAASKYQTMNLEAALKEEGIDYDLKDYQEKDDQVIIYLFRGKGCKVCRNFLTFLNSIVPEYGKYFRLVSYETWNNAQNKELLDEVADFTGVANEGVPYIVIGDEVFGGYYSGYDEDIKKAIKDEYSKKNKYDIMKEMNKEVTSLQDKSENKSIWYSLLFAIVSTGLIITYVHMSNKKVMAKLEKIEAKVKGSKK